MATQLAPVSEHSVPALSADAEKFELLQRQARMFASSPLVPDHLRKGSGNEALANCYIALTLAQAMGEVPLVVMQNIHVVNGKAGFATQYMIARANASGIFKGRIDWRIDRSDDKNLSVTAYAILKETGQEVSVTCDMAMATAEGWTKNPKYRSMPEVMLRYRSAAFLVRFYAPDVMLGYQSTEEIEDVGVAAGPDLSATPLTTSMLIEQAAPAQGEQVDVQTGEVIEANPEPAPDKARQMAEKLVKQIERDFGRAKTPAQRTNVHKDYATAIAGLEQAHPDLYARATALFQIEDEEGAGEGEAEAAAQTVQDIDGELPTWALKMQGLQTKMEVAETVAAVEGIERDWLNLIRPAVDDEEAVAAFEKALASRKRELRAQQEG